MDTHSDPGLARPDLSATGARPPATRRLLAGLGLALVAGAWLASCAPPDAALARWTAAGAVLCLVAAAALSGRLVWVALWAATALAAASRAAGEGAEPHPPPPAVVPGATGPATELWSGGVWTSGDWSPGPAAELGDDPQLETAALGGVLWSLPRGLVEDGDRVAILAAPEPVQWARGPVPGPRQSGPQALRAELRADQVVRLASGHGAFVGRLRAQATALRGAVLARCDRIVDEDARGLVAALLLGDLRRLRSDLPDLFQRTGTFHVLAVSGLQVALLAALLVLPLARLACWLLRQLVRVELAPEPLALGLLLVFVALVGGGAPILRAVSCFALGLCAARWAGGSRVRVGAVVARLPLAADALSVWWLALVVEVLVRPRAPLSLSMQLSFGATMGLLLGTHGASAALRAWLVPKKDPRAASLRLPPPAWRVWLDALARRTALVSATALGASLAATLATLPFLWNVQHEWSPVGVVATPLVFAPMFVLLFYGWAWLCLPFLPQEPLAWSAEAMLALLHGADALPGSPSALPLRPDWLVAAATALVFAVCVLRAEGARRVALRLAALCWAVLLVPWTAAPAALEVHALSVGAGSCTLVRGPGLGTWLVDAGSRDRRDVPREAVAPLLAAWECDELSLVATHDDRDHDGALPWLAAHRGVALHAGSVSSELDKVLGPAGAATLVPASPATGGVELALERGLDIRGNEGSRCVRISGRRQVVLVCGDAEAEGLEAWLERTPEERVDLLVWPHHGADFLAARRLVAELEPAETWFGSSAAVPPAVQVLGGRAWRSSAAASLSRTFPDP